MKATLLILLSLIVLASERLMSEDPRVADRRLLTSDELDKIQAIPDYKDPGGEIDMLGPNDGDDVNGQLGQNLEDDMMIRVDDATMQLRRIVAKDAKLGDFGKRLALGLGQDGDSRWPQNIIPYQFDDSVFRNKVAEFLIQQAMKEWQSATCLRFEPYDKVGLADQVGHTQRMLFQTTKSGCHADLGFKDPKWFRAPLGSTEEVDPNVVNLGSGCVYKRIILHEIGHGLGLYHQHSRPDRDDFIHVYRDNVEPKMWYNFEIPEPNWMRALERDIPYDYNSIMHYGKFLFAKKDAKRNGGFTIKPKQPCYLDVIGTVKSISFYDAKLINRMYKCDASCDQSLCSDYQKRRNCYVTRKGNQGCKCYCPEAKYQTKCDKPCPWGDLDIGTLAVGTDEYKTCTELHAVYPNYACLEDDYKDKCCGTCLAKNKAPCRDKSSCRFMSGSCEYINVRSDCPVKCGLAREGERKCAEQECKDDETCAELYAAYPNRACLDDRVKDRCCATCKAKSTFPCRDKSDCGGWSQSDCSYTNVKNDCPVKCGLAREGERKCAKQECKDETIQMRIGSTRYSTCTGFYAAYPNYVCLEDSFKDKCCSTCKKSAASCRDKSSCRRWNRSQCGYINVQNDCPVKCGLAKREERNCAGN